jgi:replicative DNA helicase
MKADPKPLRDLLDAQPPSNRRIEAEALQVAMTGDERFIGMLFAGLEADDFTDPFHKTLFVGLRDAWHNGMPLNTPGCLIEALKRNGLMEALSEAVGGCRLTAEAVALTMQSNGLPANSRFYISSLRALRRRRELVRLAMELIRHGHDHDRAISVTLIEAQRQMERMAKDGE